MEPTLRLECLKFAAANVAAPQVVAEAKLYLDFILLGHKP
jgi:hypothetical protein